MLKQLFAVLTFLTFNLQTQAREWIDNSKEDSTQYLAEYDEDYFFILEIFKQPKDGFQDRVARFSYATAEEREAKLQEILALGQWDIVDTAKKVKDDFTQYVPNEVNTGVVWQATNTWSEYWETQFASWVQNEFDENFFQRYNIETDCADVAYSLRWIFARINRLPMGSRLGGSMTLVTNETMRAAWQNLPTHNDWHRDRRFLALLAYVTTNTYTHTLWPDSYPIAVNALTVRPGTIVLYLSGGSGHTRIMARIGSVITLIASTVPRAVRPLHRGGFYDYRFPSQVDGSQYGLLRMRWPVKVNNRWQLLEPHRHPSYSLEQFTPEYSQEGGDHYQVVTRRLQQVENPLELFNSYAHDVSQALTDRPQIVIDGFNVCRTSDCAPGTANFENYSTPNRDGRLKDNFSKAVQLKERIRTVPGGPEAITAFEAMMSRQVVYNPGETTEALRFVNSLLTTSCPASVASDPSRSIANRWCVLSAD